VNGQVAQRLHAVKVASAATAIVAATAIILVVVLNLLVVDHLRRAVDARLNERLGDVVKPDPGAGSESGVLQLPPVPRGNDLDGAPTFVWQVTTSGTSIAQSSQAPVLPVRHWSTGVETLAMAGATFRLHAIRSGSGWLVAGESVGQFDRVNGELLIAEGLLGMLLLIVAFAGSLIVGLRASAPIEQIRRRQSEFTADASHELRTPLSVIEAEIELALGQPRGAADYEATLRRVSAESARLRSIVTDLLWLARADNAAPGDVVDEVVDVAMEAEACVERFVTIADADDVDLSFHSRREDRCVIHAQIGSIDRLTGVLVDNACRYAGPEGSVEVSVTRSGGQITLTVDDSGPGIPDEHREFVFDRFHRASDSPEGTGLGLAIADAVVRNTNGTWTIDRSPFGGARMAVSWRQAPIHPSMEKAGGPDDAPNGVHGASHLGRRR
jgi:two-component system, OmpR family, sensor histidine kinase CiaH